jgi:hypothetical protein
MALDEDLVEFVGSCVSKCTPDVICPIEKKGMAMVGHVASIKPDAIGNAKISPARIHFDEVLYFDPRGLRDNRILIFDDAVFSGRTMLTAKKRVGSHTPHVFTAAFWLCNEAKGIEVDFWKRRLDKSELLDEYFNYHFWLGKFRLASINDNPVLDFRLVPSVSADTVCGLLELQAFSEVKHFGTIPSGYYERIYQLGEYARRQYYVIKAYYGPSSYLSFCVERFSDVDEDIGSPLEISSLDRPWLDFIQAEMPQVVRRLAASLLRLGMKMEFLGINLEGTRRRNQSNVRSLLERKDRLSQLIKEAL